jgi:Ca-activated chloride channel family protein
MRRLAAPFAAALATVAALGAFPGSAAAADRPEPPREPPRVELVLDVSGSMRENDAGGMTRIAAAQRAFNEVVDAVPDGAYLGVRLLGATYPGNDKAIGCQDTQQIAPVGPPNKLEIKTAIGTLRPTGFTPIGLALRGAAQDLGTGPGTRRIVLITDGEDSCAPPDPCEVARELAAMGTHLVVDTLGLVPDEKTRAQLTCIAEATGGTYTAVNNADDLADRMTQLVERAVDTAQVIPPTATHGSPNGCADAPLLGPGVYSDREEFEQHLWYRVPVVPGQELRASATIGADRRVARDYDVTILATTPDGRELTKHTDAGSGRIDTQSAGLRYPVPGDGDAADARIVCLVVSNAFAPSGAVARTPGMPLELTVDLVEASASAPSNTHGLGRGWVFVLVLAGMGLVAGMVFGWLARLFAALRRTA